MTAADGSVAGCARRYACCIANASGVRDDILPSGGSSMRAVRLSETNVWGVQNPLYASRRSSSATVALAHRSSFLLHNGSLSPLVRARGPCATGVCVFLLEVRGRL